MTSKAAVALAGLFLACAPPALAQERPEAVQHDTAWHNAQMLHLVSLKAEDGWRPGPGGMRYRRTVGGPAGGPRPAPNDTVTIHYAGRLIDGTEFDSSIARGQPATFPLLRLIKGWQEGVPLMTVGDTFEFALPAHLAYGPKGKGPIPGGATLLFTIQLIAIVPPEG